MGTTYKIKPGDNLSTIAKQYGTTVSALQSANGISNPNLIIAGRNLTIPNSNNAMVNLQGDSGSGASSGYQRGEFKASDETNNAYNNLTNASNALTDLGDFSWINQGKLDDYTSQYENRDKFSYDLNTDAIYQQYKDKYIKQAKMASADVMGQAAAMNGGYGSSYAQTVGNQAYQAQLGQLNDVIPELYQLAYEKYNNEGQDMLNMISLLRGERDFAYGQHNDQYSKLANDRDYWSNMHNNLYNRDYTAYSNDEAYKYGAYRDSVADKQWQDNFDFAKQQYEDSQFVNAGGSYKAEVDSSGNKKVTPIVSDNNLGAGITSDMRAKAKEFTSNDALANWAYGLADSGVISETDADRLIAEYMDTNEKYVTQDDGSESLSYSEMAKSTNGWEVESGGGGNLFGIDANAKVKTPTGEILTLKNLKAKLVAEGMNASDATKLIKKLQQNLGISSNWLFGL